MELDLWKLKSISPGGTEVLYRVGRNIVGFWVVVVVEVVVLPPDLNEEEDGDKSLADVTGGKGGR